jgi:hypothetical protein
VDKEKLIMKAKKIMSITLLLFLMIVIFVSCKKSILTATKGSTLVVSISPSSIPVGGKAIVKVIGYKASGTPLPDGTIIFFSTTIGSIDEKVEMRRGIATAKFSSNEKDSGIAKITVSSGNVEPVTVEIKIGISNLSLLSISAEPKTLGPNGGYSRITVRAYNDTMIPLENIPVILSSDKGSLDSEGVVMYTDDKGEINDRLYTEETATVSAKSGSINAQIEIEVKTNSKPTANFVYSPSDPSAGQTIYFNAEASEDSDGRIVRYRWDFGDGSSGSGKRVSHSFVNSGTYSVTLTVYDEYNKSDSLSKTITVN